MIFNIRNYTDFKDRKYGDVLTAINSVAKTFIPIKLFLEFIFVFVIMMVIFNQGIMNNYLTSIIAFIFSFNISELMANLIIAPFVKRKVSKILIVNA